MIKKITMILLIIFSITNKSFADSKNQNETCTAERGLTNFYMDSIRRNADLARKATPIINEIREINSKAEKKDIPIEQQLTQEEKDKFNLATAQLRFIQSSQYIASSKESDSQLLLGLLWVSEFIHNHMDSYLNQYGRIDEGFNEYLSKQEMDSEIEKYLSLYFKVKNLSQE